MTGEQKLAVPRWRAWEALNDPNVLQQCLPGCQSLERKSAERMMTTLAIKVGPIGARLAQLGGPIIDATAKRLASSFFKKFGERVTAPFSATAVANTPESVPQLPSQPPLGEDQ